MEQAEAPSAVDKLISRRVRAALGERRISGAELARRLGQTQSYVSRRLRDDVPWRAADLEAIAAELGVPIAQFVGTDAPASAA